MKKNVFVLVLCALMVFSSIPKTVKADEVVEETISIETTEEGEGITAVYGDVDTTASEDTAVYLDASYEGSSIDVTVGDINAGEDGVDAYAWYGGSVRVKTGNIEAVEDGTNLDTSHEDSSIDAKLGDINAGAVGVDVSAYGGSVKAETGNIKAEEDGVYLDADDSENSKIDITTGNIEAGENGVYVFAWAGSDVTATTGSINAQDKGVRTNAKDKGTIDVRVNGDINAIDDRAIDNKSRNEAIVGIRVNGDVSSKDSEAVNIETFNKGSFTGIITGDVTSEQTGIFVGAGTGGNALLDVAGDVKGEYTGIYVSNYFVINDDDEKEEYKMTDTMVGILVEGDISGNNGVYLDLDSNANVFVVTEGNITGRDAVIIDGTEDANSTVDAVNVEGTFSGVNLNLRDNSSSRIIADTIKGDEVSIALSTEEDQSAKDIQVVAWKIELNKNGNVAENMNALRITSPNEKFEKNNILYVLKLEQPEEGGDIALDMEREIDTFYDDEAWGAANEGTKVYVNVNLKEGYMITGLYNGKGEKQELEKDDKGYYIVVPKGGGVYLTALLQANYNPQPAPSSDDDSDPDYDYSIIDQTKGSQVIRGGESYFVRINAPINDYDSTWVDNKNISKYVTVTEGSTIVTLDPGFLSTLSVGWHNLMVKFKSGREVFSRFVITKSNSAYKVPTTGVDRISHQYKGYSVALFAIVSSIAIIKSKKAYKVR